MKKGFTLLEVLIAGGILFLVAAAVVGLSNTLVQGTGMNADQTAANRLATEGLDLVGKIVDDSIKSGGTVTASGGEKIWFAPAADSRTSYGWYELDPVGPNWKLSQVGPGGLLRLQDITAQPSFLGSKVTSAQTGVNKIDAFRLICVEAVGAQSLAAGSQQVGCNLGATGPTAYDGDRSGLDSNCRASVDLFCSFSRDSLNRNHLNPAGKFIPDGNAVKIRSVVVWQEQSKYQAADIATLLTNWKGIEQNL